MMSTSLLSFPSLERTVERPLSRLSRWGAVRLLLSRRFFSVLLGMTANDWLRLLYQNRFAIDVPFWPRAAFLSAGSLVNSLGSWWENQRFAGTVAKVEIKPPLFVLGHWRQGTTHLHNLLGLDPQFCYPNFYQVLCPHTFLSTEKFVSGLLPLLLPEHRLMDNVREGHDLPHEDEFALSVLTLHSQYLGMVFPRREEYYDRYLTFRGVAADEIAHWKRAFVFYLRKLTWKYNRPVLLKSPPHTARIKLLLELFPEARFVHIYRNPYTVFQSTRRLHEKGIESYSLQRPNRNGLDERILRRYQVMYDTFFEERPLIPEGRLCEVRFEDLERDPVGEVKKVYEHLQLPGFDSAEDRLMGYVRSTAGYKKNDYAPLDPELRSRIATAWERNFRVWGYEF
jgi:hypothetical protein